MDYAPKVVGGDSTYRVHPSRTGQKQPKILLLTKEPEREMAGMSFLYVMSLRHQLQSAGLELEFHFIRPFGRNSPRSDERAST